MEIPEDDIPDPLASALSDAPEDTEAGLRTVGLSFVLLTNAQSYLQLPCQNNRKSPRAHLIEYRTSSPLY